MTDFLLITGAIWGTVAMIGGVLWVVFGKGQESQRGKQNEATIKDVATSQQVDNSVSSADDTRVIDELRKDWTK